MDVKLKSWVVVGLFLGTAVYALAEDITLTTYYPSPRGVYQELKTAGDLVVGDITNPPAARLHVVQEGTAAALRVDDELSDTSPVLVDASGNVGIGTTSPLDRKLVIRGNGTSGGIELIDPAAGGGTWDITPHWAAGDGNLSILRPAGTGNILLAPAGGNVGIGTESPAQRLTVAGVIETTSGGVMFPDATLQMTATQFQFGGIFTSRGPDSNPMECPESVNPITGAHSCPSGFTEEVQKSQAGGGSSCNGVDRPMFIHWCYQ